ncbi:MAG: hypothetical protein GQ574_28385 [Crocinitomix sp.]|nr:hypothetical protein [Crocinitomix sp.]
MVSDETWLLLTDEQELVFPKGFIRHLSVICVGTARGILHAKTEGTKFNEFILPTINVEDLIQEDASFELKEEE